MNTEKYSRSVKLLCPTCGYDQCSQPEGKQSDSQLLKCDSWKLKINRSDLIQANQENIDENVKEIGHAVVQDLKSELLKAFCGNKFLKIK